MLHKEPEYMSADHFPDWDRQLQFESQGLYRKEELIHLRQTSPSSESPK